jgi:hypothetical protein
MPFIPVSTRPRLNRYEVAGHKQARAGKRYWTAGMIFVMRKHTYNMKQNCPSDYGPVCVIFAGGCGVEDTRERVWGKCHSGAQQDADVSHLFFW